MVPHSELKSSIDEPNQVICVEVELAEILSYGVYVPIWRISRDEIAQSLGRPSMGGERSVASWDEDSLTMAVQAGLDCLEGVDSKEVDGLFFATVSSPFKEKQAAAIIATALDLRKDIYTFDITGSLRAGTLALKAAYDAIRAGGAKRILVIAADSMRALPQSDLEQTFGDGAVALLVGESNGIAQIEDFSTTLNAILGPWKREEDVYPKVFDTRLNAKYGLLRDVPQTVNALMKKSHVAGQDVSKFAFYGPDARSYMGLARMLNIDAKTQLQDSLFTTVGITGTAHCLLLLTTALDGAEPGQRIICSSYGDGSDAFLVKVTEKVGEGKSKTKSGQHLASKEMLGYGRFLNFKKEIDVGWPEPAQSSVVKYWRDEDWLLSLYGMRCRECGTLQYPVGNSCMVCGLADAHERVKLARKGKVFSYTHDYLLGPGNLQSDGVNAITRAVVDLEDGCRLWVELTEHQVKEVDVGAAVELTFRLLHQRSNYRFYGWKARPLRE
jgi:3-hydroxy-3-methylglutaryl CoA synthase